MKKIFLLSAIMLLFVATVNAQIGQQPDREDRISMFDGFDVWNGFVGGKVLPNGKRRNPASLDFKGGARLNVNYWEFSAGAEIFPTIDYYAIFLGLHKEVATIPLTSGRNYDSNLAMLMGFEINMVERRGLDYSTTRWAGIDEDRHPTFYNPTLSTILRWDRPFNFPGYIDGQGTLTFRYDIKDNWGRDAMPSGTLPAMWDQRAFYLSFGFYIDEIFNLR